MTFDVQASKFSLKKRICFKAKSTFKNIATVESSDSEDPENPEDVKKRLQKMELLKTKLNCQQNICVFGIIVTLAVYFLFWYCSECWALPFQDSPCKRTRDLPLFSTNQSTLADAVDEFTLALRNQIDKFRDGIEIPHLAKRQTLSNGTKNEIGQLFSHYSADLDAFAAIKIEDVTVREMVQAMSGGYLVHIIFLFISMSIMIFCLHDDPETLYKVMRSAKGSTNSQNVRLKELRKQIPLQYIATFVCIAAAVMLFFTFTMGHYYSGSSPVFGNGCRKMKEFCPFLDYRNYLTKLEAILNRHFGKLDSFMASPILEVRQTVWLYEIDVIDAAIENHQVLKKFNVDRRTMPPEIPQNPRNPPRTGWIILALRAQIAKFRNTIEIPHLTERQALSNTSKNEIGPLFSKYSEDLVAFAALKREDERLKEVEEAIAGGFIRILPFYIKTIICVCMYYVGKRLKERDHHQKIDNQILSAEESKNFHNRRLRQLEKRIPLLYIATFISIPLEVAQFFALFDGHCYGGNSPSVKNDSWNAKDCSNPVDSNNCTFTDYPNYAANLETILYRQIDKLDNYTASPLIEVRQMAWMKEGGVIDAAIENHLDLKQYNVDRQDPEKPGDVKKRLQKMELLEKELNIQRNICAFGVIFTVAVYFLIWYNTECWALPFQESPCKRIRDLPLFVTNQSTLAEAVDEFTLSLRAQIAKFQDGIQISHLAERQALSNVTKYEIRQLFSNYSADLIAFGALKREDASVRELVEAQSNGYLSILLFLFINTACMAIMMRYLYDDNKYPAARYNEMRSAKENENSENVRLKRLKKQIPLQYIATFVWIAAGVTLFFTFSIGHYYSGSSPALGHACNTSNIKNGSQEREFCPFIHYRNFLTKLEAILNRHFGKLDSFMASPILEVRQTVWLYESDVIDAAIENHQELKQFNVDRRTMPTEISQNTRYPPSTGWILSDSEDPENPEYVKERLRKMELFEKKLEVQRNTCAFGVILSVALYFLIWYFNKCWAFPFQESPCKQPRALPLISTNQSTLADAVDEFTVALRAQIAKFRDGIEISHLPERQALSNTTKNEIRQLFSNYSADLAAFGALKREDTRIQELEAATSYGSTTVFIFLCISILCMGYIAARLHALQSFFNALQRRNIEISLEEGSENSPKVRLKRLKRRIPILYIATSVCIAVGITLFLTFSIGHYYSGSSPAFMGAYCNMSEIRNQSQERENCPFTYYFDYSTKLEPILNRHFAKLDSFMASPILEVRQTVWLYEIDVIDTAIENHLELKQFNADRRTMHTKLPHYVPPHPGCVVTLCIFLVIHFIVFYSWVVEEGSVWRVFSFFRI
ncbi:hypothetical protein Ddc_10199 [Ditylenchus destructor]|nr:hypothetical protein Ddc_10199 [Ditylenchus destructor]